MKQTKQKQIKKIKQEDLPEEPTWLKALSARVKTSRWAEMSEEEVGQLTEELAERGSKKRHTRSATT